MQAHNSQLENSISRTLNHEQNEVFLECIHGSSSVFCTGRGGTGKSRVTESVIKYFREAQSDVHRQIAVTASTGIAAFLIKGITLHRFAGIGIIENDKEEMLKKASKGKTLRYWKETHTLIIDEISMISAQLFDNLSYIAQSIRDSDEPFGNIRLLIFGDFLQLPPISKGYARVSRAFESDTWNQLSLTKYVLNTIIRQQDTVFTHMISNIRLDKCTYETCEYFESLSRDIDYEDGIDPVRLYSLRATTDAYNQSKLESIKNQSKVYGSIDVGDQSSLIQCPAPKVLNIKTGCQVMLIRNINNDAINGSIGTVIGFKYMRELRSFQPLVKFVGHNNKEFVMSVSRCTWETITPDGIVASSRTQVPLILAWAMTIHKSQGQTIPRLYVDLTNVFESGQAYVALSRCTDPSYLQVVGFTRDIVKADQKCIDYYMTDQDDDATIVAKSTNESWGSHTADTLTMLSQLSIQETSGSSHQDSETL